MPDGSPSTSTTTAPASAAAAPARPPAPAYVPGPPVPAEPPPPVPEFAPVFEPPVTHDLRTVRKEQNRLQELLPIDPSAANPLSTETTMVEVPAVELRQLRAQTALQLLAVDLTKSDLPTDEAVAIARVFHEGINGVLTNPSALPAAVTPDVIKAIAAPPVAPAKTGKGVLILILASIVAAATGVGFVAGRGEGRKEASLAAAKNSLSRRNFYPFIGGFNTAVFQGLRIMQQGPGGRLLWVTTEPMNPYFWNLFGGLTQKGARVQVVIVGNSSMVTSAMSLARINRVDLYFSSVRIDQCNLVQIDHSLQIDGSNDTMTYSSSDPRDLDQWTATVGKEIFKNARSVLQSSSSSAAK